MGRRRNFAPTPPKEELEELYLPDRQNKRQIDLATHYGVSRDTIKDWLNLYGIEKRTQQRELAASAPTRQAKRVRDPKRNLWLDADGEAPPMRPDVTVKPTRRQAFAVSTTERFVIAEARQKSAPTSTTTIVTAAEAAPLLRKARQSPHGERARTAAEALIAYKFRREYAL